MKIKDTLHQPLLSWMMKREAIRLLRVAGEPWPWTDDPILRDYKFCNVFRRFDRTTEHYCKWMVKCFEQGFSPTLNTMAYRLFNLPSTMDRLPPVKRLPSYTWRVRLEAMHASARTMFGSAYMITNARSSMPKYKLVLQSLEAACAESTEYSTTRIDRMLLKNSRMQQLHWALCRLPMVGPFLAYEIVTDLRYYYNFDDVNEWANLGPGARRGLNRLHGFDIRTRWNAHAALDKMQHLLHAVRQDWPWANTKDLLHLREIEHSLCEYDKYTRVKTGQGRMKSKYIPKGYS